MPDHTTRPLSGQLAGSQRRLYLRALVACLVWLPLLVRGDQIQVNVSGGPSSLQQNARTFVGTVEGRNRASLRRYGRHAEGQVRQALRALGYYEPTITRTLTEEDPPRLIIDVVAGEPVLVRTREVSIRGPAADDSEFMPQLPERPAVGDVLHHGEYDALRQIIRNRASRLGYFDGEFLSRRLEVDPAARTADILLEFESGDRYRLGDVLFSDDHGFDPELMQRFVTFEPGELYHADKVARLSSDLSNSGYFSGVVVDAAPSEAEDGVIPVNAELRTRDPRSLAGGVGFSTDVGPRLRGTWTEHWINERGHRRGAETELSEPRQSISGWYELPLDPPMTDSIRLSTGYLREDIEDVESERLTLGQQWRHQLDNGWMRVSSLRWEGERFSIGGMPTRTTRLLLPGVGFSKLQVDSPIDPSRGFRLEFGVAGGLRDFLSTVDVLHLTTQARGLITVADKHRLLTRFELSGIATNRFADVPPSLRFFAGGDQSVRGYGYETLSPVDENDVSVGGRYKIVGSVEYQYEIAERWRLAAFIDEGNAVDDLFDPLATGVGVGVRWISPVGPIRFDVARGLDDEFGGGWRLHFSMGPEL
ncbi:autotransporter assembly complex family protein [uncultured Marinobacter sp.]|uniref:autotransporter assembly complex protein TamA n=1 Tax=uncultured Marinobacter sp. TaxID=187379 RepID=UPI0030DDDCCF